MKLILACLLLVGPVESAFATEATYRCVDGTRARVVFRDLGPAAGTVRLTFAGRAGAVALPQASSADGGRYADGNLELWIKGKTARLTRAGIVTDCTTR